MDREYQICIITANNETISSKIAQELVEKKLAACVNIITSVKSIYWWQDKIEKAEEIMLIAKTRKNLAKDIIQTVKELHSYTTAEIIFFDIADGNEEYLDWIGANTLFSSNISKDKIEKEK